MRKQLETHCEEGFEQKSIFKAGGAGGNRAPQPRRFFRKAFTKAPSKSVGEPSTPDANTIKVPVPPSMKVCGGYRHGCGKLLPLSAFGRSRGKFTSCCRPCSRKIDKGRDKKRGQARRLWVRFRMRLGDYQRLLEAQGNACARCLEPFTENTKEQPQVDHDHAHCEECRSGLRRSCRDSVRGLVCRKCNVRLRAKWCRENPQDPYLMDYAKRRTEQMTGAKERKAA
jgi:hypothetical protein